MRKNLLLSTAAVLLFAAPAFAADLPSRRVEPMAPVVSLPLFSWTGFYVGANAGWHWGQGDRSINNINVIGGVAGGQGGDSDGFTAGGQLGYNWQYNQFVFGVEGDINYVDNERSSAFTTTGIGLTGLSVSNAITTKSEMNWLGTARARVGVTYDRFLIYGTGGFAFADIDDKVNITSNNGVFSTLSTGGQSDTRWGWTIGAGVEYAFMNNWSTKLEYLYYKLEDKSYAISGPVGSVATFKSKPEGSILRAGINYRFSTY